MTAVRQSPSHGLLHPAALASVALLLVNDHYLKATWPGWLTGKLSDFAGLAFFPLLLAVGATWLQSRFSRGGSPTGRWLAMSIAVTGAVFASIQISDLAGEAYRRGLALLQWPVRAALRVAEGETLPGLGRAALTPDPTDWVALPALGIAWWIGRRAWGPESTAGCRSSSSR